MDFPGRARRFFDRVQGGDAFIFLYMAAIVRQYLCWLPLSNPIAWIASGLAAGGACWVYVITSKETRTRAPRAFWVFVVLPVTFAFSLRVAFPDVSFDVLNHRMFQQVRALTGFLERPGDFFPTPGPFNTVPDMALGITRLLFGYRLGTILNLLALLWSGRILDRLFRSQIPDAWLRALCVLAVFAAEHLFFEINTYLVDLLALPLLLEATRLALQSVEPQGRNSQLVQIAFLLGLGVALKLTNLVLALPIVLLAAWTFLVDSHPQPRGKELRRVSLFSIAVFLVPVLPFSLYLYQQTGSPVFPILNGVFKSPYWSASTLWDPRWGPHSLWEILSWPIQILFYPERLSELSLYSGRLSLGLVAGLLALFIAWRNQELRRLCFLLLASLFLWSATTGYIRYALSLELLSGILVIMLVVQTTKNKRQLRIALLFTSLLVAQTTLACRYVARTEWSRRPTIFELPNSWKDNAQYFLRDRSLRSFSSKTDRTRFNQVEVWIESSMKTVGFEILLNEKAPIIGLRTDESFASSEALLRFVHAIEKASGKRMFTLCFTEDLASSLEWLKRRGLAPAAQTPVSVPFFSREYRLPFTLIEVTGAEQAAAAMRKRL